MSETPAVTAVTDFAAADDFTKKHTPYITIEKTAETSLLTVEVGHEIPHPNGADHYITWIEVLAQEVPIARVDLSPGVTRPRITLPVVLPPGTVLRALEHCNLHGVWSYEVTV